MKSHDAAAKTPHGGSPTGQESAIYQGFVRHRRFTPRHHEFRYRLFMVFIKLGELDSLCSRFRLFGTRPWHWARFRRADYLGAPDTPLATAVKQKIASAEALPLEQLEGDVYFYGHLRYLGFYFSPLNLYFLKQRGIMRFMVAEVSNTPWNQRHYYVVNLEKLAPHHKEFHVSPFNPMDQDYIWKIKPPDQNTAKSMVHLAVQQSTEPAPLFDATMVLKRKELNRSNLLRVLIATPIQTMSMVVGIYWQALKLYLKKVPIHPHPNRSQSGGLRANQRVKD